LTTTVTSVNPSQIFSCCWLRKK